MPDGLGSVINLSDESGNRVTGYGYDSFGNLITYAFGGSYSYTGRKWDDDAKLYYYRARFYDPEVGRFITQDPIGFAGGDVNLYSYVGQNPVNWIDPSGLAPPGGLSIIKWWLIRVGVGSITGVPLTGGAGMDFLFPSELNSGEDALIAHDEFMFQMQIVEDRLDRLLEDIEKLNKLPFEKNPCYK